MNRKWRIWDEQRAATAADLRRAVGEHETRLYDVRTNRQAPIAKRHWHLLVCQVRPGVDVYVSTVGTFGVASASYSWPRVAASSLGTCWWFDDYHLGAGGAGYRPVLIPVLLCAVCVVPLLESKRQEENSVAGVLRAPAWYFPLGDISAWGRLVL